MTCTELLAVSKKIPKDAARSRLFIPSHYAIPVSRISYVGSMEDGFATAVESIRMDDPSPSL